MDASTTPRPPTVRRFTLLDGMIAVGAVALWLGQRRYWWYTDEYAWSSLRSYLFRPVPWSKNQLDAILGNLLPLATPMVISATVAALALRLRKPRPRWHRLSSQPGLVASLVTALALLAGYGFACALYAIRPPFTRAGFLTSPEDDMFIGTFAYAWAPLAGFGVVVAWGLLALGGRWRAEASWVDRLGRSIGVASIALGLIGGYFAIYFFI
jgi:hypothetical protein